MLHLLALLDDMALGDESSLVGWLADLDHAVWLNQHVLGAGPAHADAPWELLMGGVGRRRLVAAGILALEEGLLEVAAAPTWVREEGLGA